MLPAKSAYNSAMNSSRKYKLLPIGQSSFEIIRSQNRYWVDKSRLIANVIDNPADVILLPRPRRFGKTLNMDMLRCFFSNDADRSELFNDSWIREQPEYWQQQGQYPVINLSLKGIKHSEWSIAYAALQELIREQFAIHRIVLDTLLQESRETYAAILAGTASSNLWSSSLKTLVKALSEHYQQPVLVLIDEYDTPIHTAYMEGYYEEMVNFLRIWLGEGLKDQPHLYRGILTGIMRVAKESMFSGLNNFAVYPVHKQSRFDADFGFVQSEVDQLLVDYDLLDKQQEVKDWYNGYRFGTATVYNPWSILYYIGDQPNPPQAHWINTSSNDLAYSLIQRGSRKLKQELQQLLLGKKLVKPVNDAVVFSENLAEDDIWSFLLATGYLTANNPERNLGGITYNLFIPNQEIHECYREIIKNWFGKVDSAQRYRDLILAFVEADFKKFEQLLQEFVLALFSYHDVAKDKPAEAVIQAFVLGLLASLTEDYRIRSNRETGTGRADLLLEPNDKSQAGFVIEFKAIADNQDIDTALENALQQTEIKQYQTELKENGIQPIYTLAIVLQGKIVQIRTQKSK